jgi:hypothetical protein
VLLDIEAITLFTYPLSRTTTTANGMAPRQTSDDGTMPLCDDDDFTLYFPYEHDRRMQPQPERTRLTKITVTTLPPPPFGLFAAAPPLRHGRNDRPRVVSFRDVPSIREIESRRCYSPPERRASWYDRAELRSMKDGANDDALLMERGLLEEDDFICLRGLEGRTQAGARRRRENRTNAYSAVFFELDDRRDRRGLRNAGNGMAAAAGTTRTTPDNCTDENDDDDDQALADVYKSVSESCQFAAYMRGVRDAVAAQKQDCTVKRTRAPKSETPHQPQDLFQRHIRSLSCYARTDLPSSSTSSSSPSSSSSSLPSLQSISSFYWDGLISSAA